MYDMHFICECIRESSPDVVGTHSLSHKFISSQERKYFEENIVQLLECLF